MALKRKRKLKKRRMSLVLLCGLLVVVLGAVLGVISLISVDVKEVSTLPPEDKREQGVVYFLKGRESGGDSWERKRALFLNTGTDVVRLTEAELNQWAKVELRKVRASGGIQKGDAEKKAAEAKESAKESGDETEEPLSDADKAKAKLKELMDEIPEVELDIAPPNFRFTEDGLAIGTYVRLPQLGLSEKIVYQVTGDFVRDESGRWVFNVTSGHLGSAPLGSVPYLNTWLQNWVTGRFSGFDDYTQIRQRWGAVQSVSIDGDALVFDFRRGSAPAATGAAGSDDDEADAAPADSADGTPGG